MTKLSETFTRDRPPQRVLIGAKLTAGKLRPILQGHARYIAGRPEGRRAVLLRCELSGLDLRAVDLSGADIVESRFLGCNLADADFEGATLTGCCFADSLLNAACFAGAELARSRFHMADLRGADFTGANLAEADLETALIGCNPENGLPTAMDTRILDRLVAKRGKH